MKTVLKHNVIGACIALVVAVLAFNVMPAKTQPLQQVIPGGSFGQGQASITNTTANVANTST